MCSVCQPIDADEETRAQAPELYDGLTGAVQRDYLKFTTEEAAQFHDQPGAAGIQASRIFNWLDEVLESNDTDEEEGTWYINKKGYLVIEDIDSDDNDFSIGSDDDEWKLIDGILVSSDHEDDRTVYMARVN